MKDECLKRRLAAALVILLKGKCPSSCSFSIDCCEFILYIGHSYGICVQRFPDSSL